MLCVGEIGIVGLVTNLTLHTNGSMDNIVDPRRGSSLRSGAGLCGFSGSLYFEKRGAITKKLSFHT